MAIVIGFYNDKGGSAKTFTTINVAVGLAYRGKKVLVIDNDPQGNTSYKFFPYYEDMKGLNDIIINNADINDVIYPTKIDNLYLLPSNMNLRRIGKKILESNSDREFLRVQLTKIKSEFDYILFDNNPSFEIFLRNLVYCCNWIVIPVNVDMNTMKGVDSTVDEIRYTIASTAVDLNTEFRILLCMTGRTKITREFAEALKIKYGEVVLDTTIRHQIGMAQLQTTNDDYFAILNALPHKEPEVYIDPESGAEKVKTFKTNLGTDYTDLVDEIERKLQ